MKSIYRFAPPLVIIAFANLAMAQLNFTVSQTSVPTPGQAAGVAIGDLNADGKPDLVVLANNGDSTNSAVVEIGNGNGTFTPMGSFDTGMGSARVVIGDFDGDGKADLAVSNAISKDISLLSGNGNGTFQPAVSILAETALAGIATGDFNGDGKLDLVVTAPAANQVLVLLATTGGTFQPPVSFSTGLVPIEVVVADLNADGKLDLVVVNQSSGGISVMFGNGDGTFQAAQPIPTGATASSCVVGDFNGDAKPDLAVVDSTGLSVLIGKGDGTFDLPQHYAATAISVGAADFNGDGRPDLVLSEPGETRNLEFFEGNGDGSFQSIGKAFGGNQPAALAVGDFNQDGKPDLAVADLEAPPNAGPGTSGPAIYFSVLINTTATPTAPSITSVVNGASFAPGIAPSTWITIQGTNLSSATRPWRSSDFVSGNLPTQLDGVAATVNGIPAYVSYISPTQLNILAPDGGATGPVEVKVNNLSGASNSFTANTSQVSPAFFLFNNTKYPAAVHTSGVFVGKTGLIAGASFAPAKPGETILLFGTGFGPTNPPLPAGKLVTAAAKLANTATVTIGGKTAKVHFAGISASGLDQLNVTIPADLPDGDATVVAGVAGSSTQADLSITVQH